MKNHKEWGVVVLCTRILFASKQQNIVQYGYEKNNNECEWSEIKLILFLVFKWRKGIERRGKIELFIYDWNFNWL